MNQHDVYEGHCHCNCLQYFQKSVYSVCKIYILFVFSAGVLVCVQFWSLKTESFLNTW